jgi:hypothetical protein
LLLGSKAPENFVRQTGLALLNFVSNFYKKQVQKQFIQIHPSYILTEKSYLMT